MPMARVRGPGHPDQVCDMVATTIVEEYTRRDPKTRAHIRVMGGHGALFVAGEVLSTADFDVTSVVKRVLGASGVRGEVEPFVALEPMSPTWASEMGARDGASVVGYATNETPLRLPPHGVLAQRVARLLEKQRTQDEDWFWFEANYEVTVERLSEKYVTVIRVGHADTKPVAEVRTTIQKFLTEQGIAGPIRINPAGEEHLMSLAHRVGSSGKSEGGFVVSSLLPTCASGAGLHLTHPLNAGKWLARSVARLCVGRELGEAVMVSASWLPLESRPHVIRIRNQRGEDLGQVIPSDDFDLRRLPKTFAVDGNLHRDLETGYLEGELPWEK